MKNIGILEEPPFPHRIVISQTSGGQYLSAKSKEWLSENLPPFRWLYQIPNTTNTGDWANYCYPINGPVGRRWTFRPMLSRRFDRHHLVYDGSEENDLLVEMFFENSKDALLFKLAHQT